MSQMGALKDRRSDVIRVISLALFAYMAFSSGHYLLIPSRSQSYFLSSVAAIVLSTNVDLASQGFDFAIWITGYTYVQQGRSVSVKVNVGTLSGSPQLVELSVSGCSPNLVCELNSTSGTPPFSSTLLIGTGSSTPARTYTVNVTGSSGEITRSIYIVVVVTQAATTITNSTTTPFLSATSSTQVVSSTGVLVGWTTQAFAREPNALIVGIVGTGLATLSILAYRKRTTNRESKYSHYMRRLEELNDAGKIKQDVYLRLRKEYERKFRR